MSGEVKEEIEGQIVWKDSEIYDYYYHYYHYCYSVVLDWLHKCRLNPELCTRWAGIPPLSCMSSPFFHFLYWEGVSQNCSGRPWSHCIAQSDWIWQSYLSFPLWVVTGHPGWHWRALLDVKGFVNGSHAGKSVPETRALGGYSHASSYAVPAR